MSDLIKPEFLNTEGMNKDIDNLPIEVKTRMVAHTDSCTTMQFSPTGEMIATGGSDKDVCIWEVKDMKRKYTFT